MAYFISVADRVNLFDAVMAWRDEQAANAGFDRYVPCLACGGSGDSGKFVTHEQPTTWDEEGWRETVAVPCHYCGGTGREPL